MGRKVSAVFVAAGLILSGCGSSTASDEPTEEELAEAAQEPEVEVTTTTVPPTTTEAPTTTVAPTTTSRPSTTTTTVDEVGMGVINQIWVISQIEEGSPDTDPVRDTLIEVAESVVGSIGRVDVVTGEAGNDVGVRVIVEASSGFLTREYQDETAIDMVSEFAKYFWVPGWFGNILESGEGGVDFDLTVDGRSWMLSAQTMVDISNRRMSPATALGL
jgi:hypothetical protein